MKRHPTFLLLILPLWATGCCSTYIQNIGKTQAEISFNSISRDRGGNVIVGVQLSRHPVNDPAEKTDLGRRFAVLNSPAGDKAVKAKVAMGPRAVGVRHGKQAVQVLGAIGAFPQTEQEAKATTTWYFWPPDTLSSISQPGLPAHLATSQFSVVGFQDNGLGYAIPWEVDGTAYEVDFQMGPEFGCPDALHTPRRSRSTKIALGALAVPAFLVDVITYPFQLLHEFYVWGDAMSALGGH